MFGLWAFWESTFWTTNDITTLEIDNVSFNWYSLQDWVSIITTNVPREFSANEYNNFNIPQGDWSGFISTFTRGRTFTIDVWVRAWNESDLNAKLDELTRELSVPEWVFKYKSSGEFREIKATMISITETERECIYYLWTITFQTSEPFYYASQEQVTSIFSQTVSPFTIELNNTWLRSLPVINIFFNLGSIWEITIEYPDRTIIINENATIWSILTIDSVNKEVRLNGWLIDYNWTFWTLNPWVNSIRFTFWVVVNVDVVITNRINYLLP